MGSLKFSDESWADFLSFLDGDPKTRKKLLALLEDIKRNGYQGIGKPEPLTGNFSGYWSRLIDKKNRIIYRMEGDVAEIAQCGSHYGDK